MILRDHAKLRRAIKSPLTPLFQREGLNDFKEFINRRKQLEIVNLFGQFDPDLDYDYKQGRRS